MAHVDGGGRAAPDDRRAGARQLVDDDAAQVLRALLDDRLAEGDRRGRAGQRHGDQLGGDPGAGAVDEGLAGQVAPLQRGARAAVEDREGTAPQLRVAPAHGDEHLAHGGEAVLPERAGDDRLRGAPEDQVEPVPVRDLAGNVARRQRRRLGGVVRQAVDEAGEPDDVTGPDRAAPARRGVEEVDGRRAGIEVNAISAEVHRGSALPVEDLDARRNGRERPASHGLRNPEAAARLRGSPSFQKDLAVTRSRRGPRFGKGR